MGAAHSTNAVQGPSQSRLLSLPAELRNMIYDFALADVQDNVCIDLEGGYNRVHKVVDKKPGSVPTDDNTSRLSLLLTCRQINNEASGIAYSKMRMSLDTVFPNPRDFSTDDVLEEGASRLSMITASLTSTFPARNLAAISVMEFPSTQILLHLLTFDSPLMEAHHQHPTACTAKCASLAQHQGLVHILFHNVKRIVLDGEDGCFRTLYEALTKGASWASVTVQRYDVESILSVFSNLEEIVVRRGEAGEQVSKVIDGKIYAAESGMEMLGMDDWLPNIKNR